MRNLSNKYGKTLLDIATNARLDDAKSASEKVVHITAEATGKLIAEKNCETKAFN